MREAERQKEEAIQYAQIKKQADKVKGQYDKLGTNYAKELEAKSYCWNGCCKSSLLTSG